MKQLVTTEWLEKNIDQVKVLDATWCLPNSNRNAEEEFNLHHIKNSIFLILTKIQIKILLYHICCHQYKNGKKLFPI